MLCTASIVEDKLFIFTLPLVSLVDRSIGKEVTVTFVKLESTSVDVKFLELASDEETSTSCVDLKPKSGKVLEIEKVSEFIDKDCVIADNVLLIASWLFVFSIDCSLVLLPNVELSFTGLNDISELLCEVEKPCQLSDDVISVENVVNSAAELKVKSDDVCTGELFSKLTVESVVNVCNKLMPWLLEKFKIVTVFELNDDIWGKGLDTLSEFSLLMFPDSSIVKLVVNVVIKSGFDEIFSTELLELLIIDGSLETKVDSLVLTLGEEELFIVETISEVSDEYCSLVEERKVSLLISIHVVWLVFKIVLVTCPELSFTYEEEIKAKILAVVFSVFELKSWTEKVIEADSVTGLPDVSSIELKLVLGKVVKAEPEEDWTAEVSVPELEMLPSSEEVNKFLSVLALKINDWLLLTVLDSSTELKYVFNEVLKGKTVFELSDESSETIDDTLFNISMLPAPFVDWSVFKTVAVSSIETADMVDEDCPVELLISWAETELSEKMVSVWIWFCTVEEVLVVLITTVILLALFVDICSADENVLLPAADCPLSDVEGSNKFVPPLDAKEPDICVVPDDETWLLDECCSVDDITVCCEVTNN